MAWGLGIAFNKKGDTMQHIALIENNSATNISFRNFIKDAEMSKPKNKQEKPEYIKSFDTPNLGKTYFHFIQCDWKEAEHLLKIGKVAVIISEKENELQYNFDPANPEAKLTYLQINSAISNQDTLISAIRNSQSAIHSTIKTLTKIGTRYIDFLIPGLIAMGIMSSLLWGVSYGLIDKRNKKLLRRMVATPMRKSDFLISHFLARLVLSYIETLILFLFAWLYFDIEICGSITALLAVIIAGNIAFSGIAILIASRTANTEVGNGLMNAVQMPMMVLSGIFFSYHNFPDWAIPTIQLLPLTMLADSIRSIFIEGAGFSDVYIPIISMAGIGIITFLAGLKIYKWY
jgi:ABC-type multidrug transport system permease subunit